MLFIIPSIYQSNRQWYSILLRKSMLGDKDGVCGFRKILVRKVLLENHPQETINELKATFLCATENYF